MVLKFNLRFLGLIFALELFELRLNPLEYCEVVVEYLGLKHV